MLNRTALVIKLRQPFVDWVNSVDKYSEPLSFEEANDENTIYLVDEVCGEDPEQTELWLEKNYAQIMMAELENWLTDEESWPQDLSYDLFRKWTKVSVHSVVLDLGTEPMEDDGF
jgi:hypothetical protein